MGQRFTKTPVVGSEIRGVESSSFLFCPDMLEVQLCGVGHMRGNEGAGGKMVLRGIYPLPNWALTQLGIS